MMALFAQSSWILGVFVMLGLAASTLMFVIDSFRRFRNEQEVRLLEATWMRIAVEKAREKHDQSISKSLSWSGNRKFEVVSREVESPDQQICSFYLKAHDHRPIPGFEPGQFLTFELKVPGEASTVTRCYSLSDASDEKLYRVSIKRVPAPRDVPEALPGVSSNFFHDNVNVGHILDVRAPSGKFFLDTSSDRPIVLIGGGVGITPVLSMLNSVTTMGGDREVWFFYGTIDSNAHAMREHLENVRASYANVKVIVCYSRPLETDMEGVDYDVNGRVSVELFKQMLPSNNYQFLMCGPPPMMESVISDLEDWGVPDDDILRESFGPASGRKAPVMQVNENAAGPEITFKRAGKTVNWDPAFDSIVKFAEANGCAIPYACLAGNCGTCLTTLIDGKVNYGDSEPDYDAEDGTFLACSCVPDGAISIDV
jgi:ferredoxin-NADP reductase